MAGLRDLLPLPNISGAEYNALEASQMGDLRRGWTSGRIGSEVNAAAAELSSARAKNEVARAAELEAQITGLRQRQAAFAPRLQRIEDVDGVGDFLDLAQSTVGSGAASMVEPVAAGTGAAALGGVLSMIPATRGVGQLLRGPGAFAAPFAVSQPQMKGEYYQRVMDDPAAMQGKTAQEIDRQAELYGAGGAALDAIIPGIVGRGLAGTGLRAGLKTASPGAKFLGQSALEGATELGQGELGRAFHTGINPLRGTADDNSERLNDAVLGAIGSAPFNAAGAYADAGYRRAGATADQAAGLVKDAAGSVVDLYGEHAAPTVDKAVDKATGVAKGLFSKAKDKVIDLRSGEVTAKDIAQKFKDAAVDGIDSLAAAKEERDILTGMGAENIPADAPDFGEQYRAFTDRRTDLVMKRLAERTEDENAAVLLDRITSFLDDKANPEFEAALTDAGDYLVEQSNLNSFIDKAERTGGTIGKASEFAGRGVRAAADVTGDVLSGLWRGMKSKRNNQSMSAEDADAELAARPRTGAQALSFQRAKLMSEYLSDQVQRSASRYVQGRPDANVKSIAQMMSSVGFELADLADAAGLAGRDPSVRAQSIPSNTANATKLAINRIANDLSGAFGKDAQAKAAELRGMANPDAAPVFDLLDNELANIGARRGAGDTLTIRRHFQNELVRSIDPATRSSLLKQGIDLQSPGGKRQLLGMVEAIATGRTKPGFDAELAKVIGKDNLDALLEVVAVPKAQLLEEEGINDSEVTTNDTGLELDDDGEWREAVARTSETAGDERQAEKARGKTGSTRMYGFYDLRNPRGDDGNKDPFAPAKRATKEELEQWNAEVLRAREDGVAPDYSKDPRAGKRPRLIKKVDGKWDDEAATARMTKRLAKGEPWEVSTKSALDMLGEKPQPARILALYRDYMRDEAARSGTTDPEVGAAINLLNAAIMDYMDGTPQKAPAARSGDELKAKMRPIPPEAEKGSVIKNPSARVTGATKSKLLRDAKEYFREHGVVIAERADGMAKDPQTVSLPELMTLHEAGLKAVDASRRNEKPPTNVLEFKTDSVVGATKKDAQGRAVPATFYVRVGDLVKLVRERRGETEASDFEDNSQYHSSKNANAEYLRDVGEGISMIMASGHAGQKSLPTMHNGEYSFKDGIPPVLRLATNTYGNLQFGKNKQLEDVIRRDPVFGPVNKPKLEDARDDVATEGDERFSKSDIKAKRTYREKVEFEQNKNAEFFSPDSREEQEPSGYETRKPRNGQRAQFAKFDNLNDTVERGQEGGGRYDGRTITDNRTHTKPHQARTDKTDKTPLDVAPRTDGKAVTGAPDEFADQRYRSITQGYSAVVPGEQGKNFPAGRMEDRGAYFGEELVQALNNGDGIAQAEQWLRMAKAPTYDKTGVTGGAHLTMPVAIAIGRMGELDLGPQEAKRLVALGKETLRIVKESDLSPAKKVAIVRQMISQEALEKLGLKQVASANVNQILDKYAGKEPLDLGGPGAKAVAPTVPVAKPATKPAPDLAKYIAAENFEDITSAPQADKFLREAKQLLAELKRVDDLSPVQLKAYEVLDRWFGKSATEDLGSFYSDGRTDDDVRKMLASAEEAGAPVGKSQPAGAGSDLWADKGRRLNRQAQEIHDSLGQSGFAATHDSPHRFDGKFDWRANYGSGEGVGSGFAREGAGTYLSTSDDTHAVYKGTFSEGGKSPTYQVSVNATDDEIMNWAASLDSQNSVVRAKLKGLLRSLGITEVSYRPWMVEENTLDGLVEGPIAEGTGGDIYRTISDKLGGDRAASEALQRAGVVGHAYWHRSDDSTARSPNYVIYDDSRIHTNYVHFNTQAASGKPATDAEIKAAKDYVAKVLGPKVKVMFEDITGYSGEWIDAEDVIKIARVSAPGAMQVAYHEALHAFFSKFVKNDAKAFAVMQALAEDPKINARVEALLAGHPAALSDFKIDGEERLAYIYQFWAAGMLDLPTKPRKWLQKLVRFFRGVLGQISDLERATALLEAFHGGRFGSRPSAAGEIIAKAVNEGMATTKAARHMDRTVQMARSLLVPANSVLRTSDSPTAQALGKEFWTNPGDEGDNGRPGYLNARLQEFRRYNNLFDDLIQGLSERDLRDVAKYLQSKTEVKDIPYAPHAEAVKGIRSLLGRFYKYMTEERGLKMGNIDGEFYYPRVWDPFVLQEKSAEFIAMLKGKYGHVLAEGVKSSGGKVTEEDVARRIMSGIISNVASEVPPTPERDDGVLAPFFANANIRELAWLDNADAEPFLSKNLVHTLSSYFHGGSRSAEYAHRFGANGEGLAAKIKAIQDEIKAASKKRLAKGEFKDEAAANKWAERQTDQIKKSLGAMEGTLGKDINDTWRNASAWATVYQNLRLLPLALFSSVVDPLGIVARGGDMKQAYDTFLRGMSEVARSWGDMLRDQPKERQADHWEKLALAVGSVDAAIFSHHVSEEYASVYMGRRQKKYNDTFFKLNGMEGWNRGARIGATKAAALFIQRHASTPEVHSARWLKELGLSAATVPLDADGNLITDKRTLMKEKGVTMEEAEAQIEKVYAGIARWVEGAIITPNAAQRPAWSSDPHWSMFFHLKQFMYSFHQTILKRAVSELGHGNLAPMGTFLWYVPVMIASDVMRGLVQGGGELPAHMKGMTLGDWVIRGGERAGLLSVGQIGVDAGRDIWSVGGPMVEQTIDAMVEPLGETTLKALPAHPLYRELFH